MGERQSSNTINSSASKQAEKAYTAFLSSQSSLFSTSDGSCNGCEGHFVDDSQHNSSPIHLELLRNTFDFSDIYPMIELQVVGNSSPTRTQKQISEEIKTIFSGQLEASFTGRSESAGMVVLVQIYLWDKPNPNDGRGTSKKSKRSVLSSIKVAYSVFNRKTRKFLMAKEIVSTKSAEKTSARTFISSVIPLVFVNADSKRKEYELLKSKARSQTQTIVDEVSFFLNNDCLETLNSSCNTTASDNK